METATMSSILVTLVCVFAIAGFFRLLNWIWLRPKKVERWLRQQGLAGTSYRVLHGDLKDFASLRAQAMAKPLTGFTHDYLARVDPLRHQLMTKFGKQVYFMWSGPKPTIVISKPELVKEIVTRMHEFLRPRPHPVAAELFNGLSNYEGEQWTQHRRLLNHAFNTEKLKLMLPSFSVTCDEMINKWKELIPVGEHREVDVVQQFNTLTADVISRAAFGSNNKGQGNKMFEILKEQLILASSMRQSLYIPGSRYIPTPKTRRFKRNMDQMSMIARGIIDNRKKKMEAGEPAKNDLLGILLDSNMKEIQEAVTSGRKSRKHGISPQEVIEECRTFYLAGQDPTSVLLTWTFILLGKYQDWQARAREEVLQTFGSNPVNVDDLSRLKIVTMILNEVLRMYPPAVAILRRIEEDTKLGDFVLPAGSFVNIPVINVHRDKESWGEDAEEFKPERFSEGVSKAFKGTNAFLPFGAGPRGCIGEKFAIFEAKLVLAMILQHFSWEVSPSYVHAPVQVMALWPQHGAQLILHRLK